MPANPGFKDQVVRMRAYLTVKTGFGLRQPNLHESGYSWGDIKAMHREFISLQREVRVSDYDAYRTVLQFWNPSRGGWAASNGAAPRADGSGRRSVMSNHRAAPAGGAGRVPIQPWKGGHPSAPFGPRDKFAPSTASARPVSGAEWTHCLAAGTQIDRQVQTMFGLIPGIQVMFVRRAEDLPHLERIEMGAEDNWVLVWSNSL